MAPRPTQTVPAIRCSYRLTVTVTVIVLFFLTMIMLTRWHLNGACTSHLSPYLPPNLHVDGSNTLHNTALHVPHCMV